MWWTTWDSHTARALPRASGSDSARARITCTPGWRLARARMAMASVGSTAATGAPDHSARWPENRPVPAPRSTTIPLSPVR
jgi:hypothetical protein